MEGIDSRIVESSSFHFFSASSVLSYSSLHEHLPVIFFEIFLSHVVGCEPIPATFSTIDRHPFYKRDRSTTSSQLAQHKQYQRLPGDCAVKIRGRFFIN